MNPDEFSEKTYRVIGTTKVTLRTPKNIDGKYEILPPSNASATPTGLVVIANLVSQNPSDPKFVLRWDSGNHELDVDIYLKGKIRKGLWNKPGYAGHKTILRSNDPREYEVNIYIRNRQIYEGVIRLSNNARR